MSTIESANVCCDDVCNNDIVMEKASVKDTKSAAPLEVPEFPENIAKVAATETIPAQEKEGATTTNEGVTQDAATVETVEMPASDKSANDDDVAKEGKAEDPKAVAADDAEKQKVVSDVSETAEREEMGATTETSDVCASPMKKREREENVTEEAQVAKKPSPDGEAQVV